ncbi:hypothetical protein HYS47_05115 [Candidatus Woesearchaeota archaeon]|nr:hypothetical protein [Candidatus Woesearchaeota archaeon]
MLQDQVIRKYFQEGLDRGFSKEYLRQNLLRHGYDPAVVASAYHALSGLQNEPHDEASSRLSLQSFSQSSSSRLSFSQPQAPRFSSSFLGRESSVGVPQPLIPQRPSSPPSSPFSPPTRFALYAILIVGVLIGAYVLTATLYSPSPTGFAVLNDQELNNQEIALNEISALDQQIEEKHTALQQQLEDLKQKDLTIEEKNRIIEEQVSELEKLHQSISEERDKIRELLLDLFNTIVDRPLKAQDGSIESIE